MANQQTNGQHRPLSGSEDGGEDNIRSGAGGRRERINNLKQKVLPGVRITLLLSLIVYFAMLVVGCLAVHKCPVQENIPLFLIATGIIGLASKLFTYMKGRFGEHIILRYIESVLYTVESIFFILGAYWTFSEYKPSYNPADGDKYCQKTAYMFAFIFIALVLALLIASLVGFLCFLCCVFFIARSETTDLEANDENTRN